MTFDEAQEYLLQESIPGDIQFGIRNKEFFLYFSPDEGTDNSYTFTDKDLEKLIIDFVEWIKDKDCSEWSN